MNRNTSSAGLRMITLDLPTTGLLGLRNIVFPRRLSSVELIRRAIGSVGLTKITFSEKSGVEKLTQQQRKMGCVYRKLLGVSAFETDLADCTAPSTVQGVRIR
jgi:hypothetical protein